jgi:hypothetical protein
MRNVWDKIVEKIKRRILYSVTVSRNSAVYEIMWEHLPRVTIRRVRICMLDTEGYKHTLRICNTYCFPTATMVVRTRPSVTLYVHFLSC